MAACGIAPEDDDANSATESVRAQQAKPAPKEAPAAVEKTKTKEPLSGEDAKNLVTTFEAQAKKAESLEDLQGWFEKAWNQLVPKSAERKDAQKIYDQYKAFLSTPFDEA